MENIFNQKTDHSTFTWESLGDIKEGRGTLGLEMPVLVYRLMQFTIYDVMTKNYGRDQADKILYDAGHLAGSEYAKNALNLKQDLNNFVASLQDSLATLKVGILRVESIDAEAKNIILTVAEDLDCSGLPLTDEAVCIYDEGFIAGILEVYTGVPYSVKEIDCWASGDRICRFKCTAGA
ncbi:MAG: 4-vinyl reductase [Candidatus Cloacimonetes bacterium]|nr:4-vinyl reductase [Candidatus Cloacimonadota bacterium]